MTSESIIFKFVPLLARRGSKLRCCGKLYVAQHCVLKEWNQKNGIQLLHNMSTKSNISTASPFFSVISCSVLIYIHLPPSPPIPSHFQIPKLVEIHKLLVGIWYIPSTALHVPAETSFLFFNCSSVESRGAIPESEKYEKKYKLCTH